MSAEFRSQRIVEFGDTDMAGIVHFSTFFRYMEAAEQAFLRARAMSAVMRWEGETISFPRVSASCDYVEPAYFEDVLDIAVAVKKIGRTSVTYAFTFYKGDRVLARGQLTAVCCRVREDRTIEAREVPAALRERLSEASGAG